VGGDDLVEPFASSGFDNVGYIGEKFQIRCKKIIHPVDCVGTLTVLVKGLKIVLHEFLDVVISWFHRYFLLSINMANGYREGYVVYILLPELGIVNTG